jgi:thiamine phosphate synthase YjbQ (UPF0047 family)
MPAQPVQLNLEVVPVSRFDVIDVAKRLRHEHGDALLSFPRAMYCSHHTTAGYVDPRTAAHFKHRMDRLTPYIGRYQAMFPMMAGYRHDEMDQRTELTDEERRLEPPNADAHLTFIGAGMQNCVTYQQSPWQPVFFMDLDGEYDGRVRTRTTTVVGFNREEVIAERAVDVPVTRHAIDSVNLAGAKVQLMEQIDDLLEGADLDTGRVELRLDERETASALTVNEYETLLMRHDLCEVLRDPLRFMARQGRNVLRDPLTVPAKSMGYAKYDIVLVLNQLLDVLGLADTAVERAVHRLMRGPAQRRLRFKRAIDLPVTRNGDGRSHLLRGRYQSPILIQWRSVPEQRRRLNLRLIRYS